MVRFIVIALVAFVLPGLAYYLWRAFAPERFGGSSELARGEWRAMPWRWLAYVGLAAVVVVMAIFVSYEGERAPASTLWQGLTTPLGN